MLLALIALFHILRSGDRIRVRLCSETDCQRRLVSVLNYGSEDSLSNGVYDEEAEDFKRLIRRTSAACVGLLYESKDNRRSLEEFEGEIFEACSSQYEVAYFLSPLLSASPTSEAPL